jgi:hypothetical protein
MSNTDYQGEIVKEQFQKQNLSHRKLMAYIYLQSARKPHESFTKTLNLFEPEMKIITQPQLSTMLMVNL